MLETDGFKPKTSNEKQIVKNADQIRMIAQIISVVEDDM